MDKGTYSGSQTAIIEEYYGYRSSSGGPSVRFDVSAGCMEKSCIDTASVCNYMNERLRTWRTNDWHDEAKFLRLNKKKCDVLLPYLEQAREKHHSNACEPAAREFLLAVKRAKFLVDESAHNKWLLKALELWECSQHFIEVRLDLSWWAHIMSLGVNNTCKQSTETVEEELEETVKEYCDQLRKAQCDDKVSLGTMVEITIQESIGDPERQLAELLEDRCNDREMRHPRILRNFKFYIRSKIHSWKSSTMSGQSGVVLRFPWVYEKNFALKMRQPNSDIVEDQGFEREFKILDQYRSPYIVGVVGYWKVESWPSGTLCPYLLMEAMECNLEGLIKKYRKKLRAGMREGFSELDTIKLMLPVAKALRFLHGNDVAHRDIKLQNIMCSSTRNGRTWKDFDEVFVKLIDFGDARSNVSRILPKDIRIAGTTGYMDPAMRTMGSEGCDLFAADVFSFAMVFVELLTWRYPWEGTGIQRGLAVQEKLNNGERPPLPVDLPHYVRFIVECCWCADPPARPTFEGICSMLQNAKLLLRDEKFSDDLNNLICYEDWGGIGRSYGDQKFLQP